MAKRKGNMGEPTLLRATATDGTWVRAAAEGEGSVILILHPGMETGTGYAQVAARLARHYRVIRLHRRQYRLDLKTDPLYGSPCTIAEEVDHVLAMVKAAGTRVLLFGHSSGATVALETLVAAPSWFVGGMIYEPASVIASVGRLHLAEDLIARNGETGAGLRQARQALVEGRPGSALGTFTQLVTGWPSFLATSAGMLAALFPAYRQLIPCQIDDLEALERLGMRLDAYSKLNLPIAMVGGERSPDPVKEMLVAIADALPRATRLSLRGQGHTCQSRDPKQLADALETFAKSVFEKVA